MSLFDVVISWCKEDCLKSAFVSIVGRPSTGKSTLVNLICGHALSSVSHYPQTTRNTIRGICTRKTTQLVFCDTPGYHTSEKRFNQRMIQLIERALSDCDLILYLLDVTRPPKEEEEELMRLASNSKKPIYVALNKIDKHSPNQKITREMIRGLARVHLKPVEIYEISARENQGIKELLAGLTEGAGEAPFYYPADVYTDQTPEFRMSEIIREEAIKRVHSELPHALYVDIIDVRKFNEGKRIHLRVFLFVETPSQKKIVIGTEGNVVRAIKAASLKRMNLTFPYKVELDLQVRVSPKWRQKEKILDKLFDQTI